MQPLLHRSTTGAVALKFSHTYIKIKFMWWGNFCCPILQNPGHLFTIVKRVQFFLGTILIEIIITRVAWFQDKGLGVLLLLVTKATAIEVAVMYFEENYLIVDSGGAA